MARNQALTSPWFGSQRLFYGDQRPRATMFVLHLPYRIAEAKLDAAGGRDISRLWYGSGKRQQIVGEMPEVLFAAFEGRFIRRHWRPIETGKKGSDDILRQRAVLE